MSRFQKAVSWLLLVCFAMSALAQSDIAGNWLGTLNARGRALRVVVKVTVGADGQVVAKLDSPNQGLQDLPLQEVAFKDQVLSFEFKAGSARYRGRLNNGKLEGEWSQGGMSAPLNFERTTQAPTVVQRKQTPQPPFPYKVEEVAARAMAAEIAANSPFVVQGVKQVLQFSEEHSTQDGLEYVAQWNAARIQINDLREAMTAFQEKRAPVFQGE